MRCDGQSKVFCLFYTIRVKFADDFKKLFSTTIPVEKFGETSDRIHDADLEAESTSSEDPVEDTSNPEDGVEEGEGSQHDVDNHSDNATGSPAENFTKSDNAESVNSASKSIDERCKVDEGFNPSVYRNSSNASIGQENLSNEQKGIYKWLPQVHTKYLIFVFLYAVNGFFKLIKSFDSLFFENHTFCKIRKFTFFGFLLHYELLWSCGILININKCQSIYCKCNKLYFFVDE